MKSTTYLLFLFAALTSFHAWTQNYNLQLVGSDSLQTQNLKALKISNQFPDLETLRLEVDSILSILERKGYFDRELLKIKKLNDSTYIAKVDLRERYDTIRVNLPPDLNLKSVQRSIFISDEDYLEIPIERLEYSLNILTQRIANQGHPFTQLQLSNISRLDQNKLMADLKLSKGEGRKVDRVIVRGYDKFPKGYLKNLINLENKIFNLDRINKKTARINDLKFANQIREPEVLFTQDSTILYIYVEKIKSNTFDGFLGFGTTDQSTKVQFNGYLNLQLTNTLDYGESLHIYYRSDENDQRTFDAQVKLPYLFKSPVGIDAQLNIFKRDTTFLTSTQNAALEYQWQGINSVRAGVSFITSNNLTNSQIVNIDDYRSLFYLLYYNRTKGRNDLLFPIDHAIDISAGLGNREANKEETSQTRFTWDLQKSFFLNSRNNIYSRVSGGYLLSDGYFQNELFRFGGINSLRGFRENSLEGNLFGILNTEYRYRLSSSLYVHTVLDAAYFENQLFDVKEKLYGFGFGIGVLTQAGLFKLNYSGSKVGNQEVKVADFKIHISLTANF